MHPRPVGKSAPHHEHCPPYLHMCGVSSGGPPTFELVRWRLSVDFDLILRSPQGSAALESPSEKCVSENLELDKLRSELRLSRLELNASRLAESKLRDQLSASRLKESQLRDELQRCNAGYNVARGSYTVAREGHVPQQHQPVRLRHDFFSRGMGSGAIISVCFRLFTNEIMPTCDVRTLFCSANRRSRSSRQGLRPLVRR